MSNKQKGSRDDLLAKQKALATAQSGASKSSKVNQFGMDYLTANYRIVLQVAVAVVAVVFSLTVWQAGSGGIQNLINTDSETLKSVLLGDKPFLFYCHRGGKAEVTPPIFSQLNSMKGSKVGFGILNCSQVMPSGKSIMDRFGLKKEWRPTIFATAPWMKPKQIPPPQMKDITVLKKYVDQILAPRATEIMTDKDLRSHCGFSRNITFDDRSVGETCIMLLKGKRHSKKQTEMEEWLIKAYPRVKMASIDAQKRRLSFEDAAALPAQDFALKVHAIRNGTHSLTMVNPVTWDYLNTFVSTAIGTPLYSYDGDGAVPITLAKTGAASSSFKDRTARYQQQYQQNQDAPTGRRSKKQSRSDGSEASEREEPPAQETETERQSREAARETRRREQMERQAKERLFEQTESESAGGGEDEEEEEEDMIEL